METEQAKRREKLMAVADELVGKVEEAVDKASSASELKQLTGALKELKDIQGLREEQQAQKITVVMGQAEEHGS